MSVFHQVVFTGELRAGVNAEQAARDFAAVFKIPEEKAWRLILDKRPHVLKREVDDANAERYREVLEEIGLEVRVEPAGTSLDEAADADGTAGGAATEPADAQAATVAGAGPSGSALPPLGGRADAAADPYAPPRADLTPPAGADDDGPMRGPQPVPAGNGWLWLKDAYALFRARPGAWLGAIMIIYLINIVISLVPLVGGLVGFLLGPVFAGGIMAGARELDRRGTARAGMVFDGFSGPAAQLVLVGVLYLLGLFLVIMASGIIAIGVGAVSPAALEAMASNDPQVIATALAPTGLLLMLLIVMALGVPLLMAYWFAPALVMLEDMTALEAMQNSFRGCWMNILPFLVYGLGLLGIGVGFAVTFGLLAGFFSFLPGAVAGVLGFIAVVLAVPVVLAVAAVAAISQYTGYRDIFRHIG
jgi:uncharacterized membrane protein